MERKWYLCCARAVLLGGKVHQRWCALCCHRTASSPRAWGCLCNVLLLLSLQAEEQAKHSDGVQPLLWPAALGHEATAQPRMGSGSSSSPCTPAPQRALLVQVLRCLGRDRGGSRHDRLQRRAGYCSSAAFRACHTASPDRSVGLYASLSITAIMGYYCEIRLYYPKCFLNSLLI